MPFVEFAGELDRPAGYVPFDGELDAPAPAEDLTRPAGALRRTIPAGPKERAGSVLDDAYMPEPEFDAAEAQRLSRRDYAVRTPIPGTPEKPQQSLEQGPAPKAISAATSRGQAVADSRIPGARIAGQVAAGIGSGIGGVARAAGDVLGVDALSRAGEATAAGAGEFERGIGESGAVAGFGPKSPVPYLGRMAEGAASSLGQSAILAGFGPGAVIPAMAVLSAGQEYDKARNAGLDPAAALAGAIPKGAFEAIGEKFSGLDKVAGAMGTLLQRGASDQAKRTAADVLVRSGIREIPGEVITYLGQTGVDLLPGIGLNPDLTMSQFIDGLRDTVVQSAMMGGAIGGGGVVARRSTPEPLPSARQMAVDRGFLRQPTAAESIADIGAAGSVDEAIAAATRAVTAPAELPPEMAGDVQQILSATTAVDNIAQILGVPDAATSTESTTDGSTGGTGALAERAGDAVAPELVASLGTAGSAEPGAGRSVPQPDAGAAAAGDGVLPSPPADSGVDAVAAPAAPDLATADPGALLLAAQDPTSPFQQIAAAELRRREIDASYAQRDQQQDVEREAIRTEARDQQASQATAASQAAEVEAPTAMQLAMERARTRAAPANTGGPPVARPQQAAPAPRAAAETGNSASAPEPASTWYGRRGDGYLTSGDAGLALRTRQKVAPELDWRIEQTAGGKYRLAGYARPAGAEAGLQEPPPAGATGPAAMPARDPRLTPLSQRNVQNTPATAAQQAAAAEAPAAAAQVRTAGAARPADADAGAAAQATPGLVKDQRLVPVSRRADVKAERDGVPDPADGSGKPPSFAAPANEAGRRATMESSQTAEPIVPAGQKARDARLTPVSKRAEKPAKGIAREKVERTLTMAKAAGLKRVTLVETAADLPKVGKDRIESEGISGVRGMYAPGEDMVYIVRENVQDESDLLFVIAHESFHRGLRKVIPRLGPVLDQIYLTNRNVRQAADRYAKEHSVGRLEAVEEVLADMAGEGTAADLKGWDRLVSTIRSFLDRVARAAGVKMEWTDDMVRELVAGARQAGIRADLQTEPGEDPKFSRTPAPKPPSPWRDSLGRFQFAPGQMLYDWLGDKASPMLVKLGMKAASPELRRQLRQMKLDVEKAKEIAVAVAKEAANLSDAEREMVSDLVEQEVQAGTIPPAHAVKLAKVINTTMEAQTDELVRLGMLSKDAADMWRGRYLPRYYKSKLSKVVGDVWADALKNLSRRPTAMQGIKGKHLKGRGLYETIKPHELPDWQALGWEVRDPTFDPKTSKDVQVWRDFTRAEREKMGEIRDSGFRFVMGYMQTQRDIALGRMYDNMANDPDSSSRLEKPGYVQVPSTKVQGTGAMRYGNLAGRWVPQETMSHLSQMEEAQSDAWTLYRQAMGVWKESKTVLNPVSHVNNILSNVTMAHLGGVSYGRADKYLAAMKDFAMKSPKIAEAKEAGLFLGTLSDAELMNTLPKTLQVLARQQETATGKVGRTTMNLLSFFLRKPMGWAYQAEDTFFRYLLYREARNNGLEPNDAVDYAQKFIFTYDDLPKGARNVRDFALPFFSYTYKAVPALLHTALTHPERAVAPAAVMWAINAAAYAIAAGDDDDSWETSLRRYVTEPEFRKKAREKEELEREFLPPWMKGMTAFATPKTIRLGMDEVTKLPLFIDVSRIIPGGDLFDVSPNAGGLPLPQPITPSHPLFSTAVAMLANKDLFRGKELIDSNDTRWEAAEKRAAWLWDQFTPAIAVNNYHWERGMNALAQAVGGELTYIPDFLGGDATGVGRDGLPVQPKLAAAQTFGIKVRPLDLDTSESIQENQKRKMIRDIDAEIASLRRLYSKGAISASTLDKKRDAALEKKDRLREGLTVDGDKRE